MRRTVLVGTTVLVVVVLATPAVRRGLTGTLESAAAGLRERVAAFRADYAAREAELRERLLPDDVVVDAATRHRADRAVAAHRADDAAATLRADDVATGSSRYGADDDAR